VRSVAGGEGWVRGKIHGSLVNLWVVMAWLRVAGGGGSAVEQSRDGVMVASKKGTAPGAWTRAEPSVGCH